MNKIIEWNIGLNDFRKNTIEDKSIGPMISRTFTTELLESDFEPSRDIDDIFYDHLKNRESKVIELLYSGGMDSQRVLESCIKNKLPVEAMTMVIRVKGMVINVVDLYYAEKFCRENNIKQNFFYLDALDFYESGKYVEYIKPYDISEPHVASHHWLLEQCQSYPIIGGDWPWCQTNNENMVLSPFKIGYSSYERFLQDKNMFGIGNFISHSFESVYRFIELHIKNKEISNGKFYYVPFLKQKVYGFSEPRIRSYGWEDCPVELFDMSKYKLPEDRIIKNSSKIIWGEKIKSLMKSNTYSNDKF